MNQYLHVFLESTWIASIIPGSQDTTIYAMHAFGGYHMQLAVLLAVTGGMLGHAFNFALGRLLLTQKNKFHLSETHYAKAQRVFHKYGIFLLLFAWLTPGNVVVLIAGFLRTPPKVVFPLVLIGVALHYGALLA